jgi:orotidine-5'-phosphate decarboxylase
MKHIADVIINETKKKNSVLVVGLDPNLDFFPDFLTRGALSGSLSKVEEAIYQFNKIVIEAVKDNVAAVKPQLAFYERYGSHGIRALEKTIQYAGNRGLVVINDAKRGDIGSTSEAYANAFLGKSPLAGDMVTVNPLLGSDAYKPFIEKARENGKGLFLLLKTSNPSSREIQDLKLQDGRPLYMTIADHILDISAGTLGQSNYSFIGAVVGATFPAEALRLRKMLPHTIFLVPGFGVQGGKAEDMGNFFDANGNGALISSTRGIIYSYTKKKENWKDISETGMFEIIRNTSFSDKEKIEKKR